MAHAEDVAGVCKGHRSCRGSNHRNGGQKDRNRHDSSKPSAFRNEEPVLEQWRSTCQPNG